ncbi:hypothetical protein Adt_26587 [Abeliophyllum distichum]|uniref:Uncharacterized protein n=1 Tax=Abeliophyllum distichum TaxID=126358 RepID=A0ABD1RVD1_9LAMI
MNLIRELVLTKELYSTLEDFDGKLNKEVAKSIKLSEDLKAMSLEKAQLESDKKFLQVQLGMVVAKEIDLKANNFEAMVAEKDKLLAKVKEEVGRVKVDCADAEARTVTAYQDGFEDMPEYKDLAHHFMKAGGEQLVERIAESHSE